MTTSGKFCIVLEFEGTVPEVAFDAQAANEYISALIDTEGKLKEISQKRVLDSDEGAIFRFVYGPYSKYKLIQRMIKKNLLNNYFHRFLIRPSITKEDGTEIVTYWIGNEEFDNSKTPRTGIYVEPVRKVEKNDLREINRQRRIRMGLYKKGQEDEISKL